MNPRSSVWHGRKVKQVGKRARTGMYEKSDPDGSLVCLVVFRHQDRGHASVGLGDEPEFDASGGAIH